MRVLGARIVVRQNDLIAPFRRYARHFGAFSPVAVAAAAHDGENTLPGAAHGVEGLEDFFQRIGRVGVVHDAEAILPGRVGNLLEATRRRSEFREGSEGFERVLVQQIRDRKGGGQIVGVERTDQSGEHLVSVQVEVESRGSVVEHPRLVVRRAFERVGEPPGAGALQHDLTVAVVAVGEGKG